MSEDRPLPTTARKRSRSPSLVEDPACTKLSRQSSSPPAGGISTQESVNKEQQGQGSQDVGVAHPTKPPKPLLIYIVNKKIPSSQLAHLKGIAKKKEFPLSTTLT